MSTVWAVLRVGPLIQAVGDDLVQDLLERIERTAVTTAPVLLELKCQLKRQARFVPPGSCGSRSPDPSSSRRPECTSASGSAVGAACLGTAPICAARRSPLPQSRGPLCSLQRDDARAEA